jgi:hypothetical protein
MFKKIQYVYLFKNDMKWGVWGVGLCQSIYRTQGS